MSTKTKKCPFCSDSKVVKRGIQDGLQTYWCKSCGKRFRNQRKAKNILTGNIFDDFVIIDESEQVLKNLIPKIFNFIKDHLKLDLHPRKTEIRKIRQGSDFLVYVSLPHYRILRTSTKNRMLRKIYDIKSQYEQGLVSENRFVNTISSYLGILKHCKSEKVLDQIERIFWD